MSKVPLLCSSTTVCLRMPFYDGKRAAQPTNSLPFLGNPFVLHLLLPPTLGRTENVASIDSLVPGPLLPVETANPLPALGFVGCVRMREWVGMHIEPLFLHFAARTVQLYVEGFLSITKRFRTAPTAKIRPGQFGCWNGGAQFDGLPSAIQKGDYNSQLSVWRRIKWDR